jgi:hypothetical protein
MKQKANQGSPNAKTLGLDFNFINNKRKGKNLMEKAVL